MASRKRFQYQITTAFFLSTGICGFQNSPFQNDAFQVCPPEPVTWFSGYNPDSVPDRRQTSLPAHQQQFIAYAPFTPAETVTSDKWIYPLSEPVRQKPGLKAHLQQSLIATTLDDETQIIQNFESRWHQAWSEPVRVKASLRPGLQQFFTGSVFTAEVVTLDKWVYPWTEPVRSKPSLRTSLQSFAVSVPVFENVTVDKWTYPWSEPVRQKPGLRAHLQQSLIATTLDDETQIIQDFESRWHYAWSEPVRFKRFPAAQQQAIAFQPPSFETITLDKWVYSWPEPVRQKLGFAPQRQSFLAHGQPPGPTVTNVVPREGPSDGGTTVDITGTNFVDVVSVTFGAFNVTSFVVNSPTSITVVTSAQPANFVDVVVTTKFGSSPTGAPDTFTFYDVLPGMWNYPWATASVQVKSGLQAGRQQFLAWVPPITETVTSDKWAYPWSEPVRQKRGLLASSQQFLALDTAAIPVSTLEPWFAPLSEPVRLKPGLRAQLQQAAIQTVLDPDTQITQGYESRWHYPWSEPVRFRRLAVAQQVSHVEPTTSVFETITLDKWVYPWTEPVRRKPGLRAALQQSLIATTLNPGTQIIQGFESRWHQPWTEPVRLKRFPTAEQQVTPVVFRPPLVSFAYYNWLTEPVRLKRGLGAHFQQFLALDTAAIPVSRLAPWYAPWREPVRLRPGLRPNLQQAYTAPVLVTEVVTSDKWLYPWSEPVRQKPGLKTALQQALAFQRFVAATGITGTFFATEQGDLFFATGSSFNQVASALVGIQFDRPRTSALVGIQYDKPLVSGNVGVVAVNPTAQSGVVVPAVASANVSLVIIPGPHIGFTDLLTESSIEILTESGVTIIVS